MSEPPGNTNGSPGDLINFQVSGLQEKTCIALARDPATTPAVLAALSKTSRWEVRRAVLAHPRCSAQTLVEALAAWDTIAYAQPAPNVAVPLSVARHPNCPPEVLIKLLGNYSPLVRQAAGENPSLPKYALAMKQLAARLSPSPPEKDAPYCYMCGVRMLPSPTEYACPSCGSAETRI